MKKNKLNPLNVGQQIRDIRRRQKRTMLDVATKLGIHYQQLQRIELTGRASAESLEKIATELQHALVIWPSGIYFKKKGPGKTQA